MDNSRLKENIRILEQGITLQKFAEMQNQLLIEGSMAVYNEYGMYVVHNVTRNVYLIDGGNSPRAFSMSTSIMQFFLTNNGCGNPYMHQHYVNITVVNLNQLLMTRWHLSFYDWNLSINICMSF